jgi:hypothetical protein
MPRNTRIRRAPNRGPTSLAAAITVLGSIEAVDIDPALTNSPFSRPSTPQSRPSTPPPPPPTPPISNEYPDLDAELDIGYIYPHNTPPPQGREVTWSPTPPPLPPPLPLPPPPISTESVTIPNNIQPSSTFRWTLEMEELLFHTLVEQVNIGKRADSGFKKEAWIACCTAINSTTIQPVSIDKCKGKVDTMKGLWREFIWLKDQSGFGYNEVTGVIEARDQAWSDIIKVFTITIAITIKGTS